MREAGPRGRTPALLSILPLVLIAAPLATGIPGELSPGAVQGSLLSIELAEARGAHEGGQAILDGLRHPAAEVRARAARAAGRWGAAGWEGARGPEAGAAAGGVLPREAGPLPPLAAMVRRDADPRARAEAVFALGQIGDPSSSAVLSAVTLDPSPSIRARALEALGKISGTPPGLLARSLGDPDPDPRGAAALALARLPGGAPTAGGPGDEGESLARTLAERLEKERDAQVRWKLAYLLSRRPELLLHREVRDRLLASLQSPSFLEAAFAAEAFGAAASRLPDLPPEPSPVEALERSASDRRQFWIARAASVRALSDLLPGKTIPGAAEPTPPCPLGPAAGQALLRLAGSPQLALEIHHFRRAVIAGLGKAGAPGAAPLSRMVETGVGGDLEAAIRAAGPFPDLVEAAGRRLRAMGDDPPERLRAALAAARSSAGDPGAFLADSSPRVRAAAVLAAGHPSKEVLVRALSDPDPAVRGAAAERIASGEGDAGTEDLARALGDAPAGEFWEVRAALVSALARKGDLSALRAALRDPHPTVARRAREALARAGEPPSGAGWEPPPPAAGERGPEFFSAALAGLRRDPRALIEVRGRGEVRLDLLVGEAPQTVAAFVRLARSGFYDGLSFHRVVTNWVVQGGDPRGSGYGGAGFSLRDETGPEPFLRGSVGIAKLDADDGSSQFFITHLPAPRLDGRFTLFARVIDGMEVVDRIEEGDAIGSIRIEGWRTSR